MHMDKQRSTPSTDMEAGKTDPANIDAIPSFGGHGTLEAREFVWALEAHGIPCCAQGVSALIYYGAQRVRLNWEICVPTDQMEEATAIFENSPDYEPAKRMMQQPFSLIHTYPQLKRVGINIIFVLVPSFDIYFEVKPENITRSFNDIPFPKLPVLVQSHIERNDTMNLTDLIDGADLSEEWGYDNLDLEGKNDGEWVAKINAVAEAMPDRPRDRPPPCIAPTSLVDKRDLWQWAVQTKGSRRGWKRPPELFATRFRLHNEPDPWLMYRESC